MHERRRKGPRPLFGGFLFFWIVVIAALPLLVVSSIQAAIYIRARHFAAAERITQTANTLAARADDYIAEHQRAVMTIAREHGSAESLAERLAQQHALYPGFLTMLATDARGVIIAAHPPAAFDGSPILGRSVGDREYFLQPKRTLRPFISRVFRGRGFGDDVIVAVSTPILDGSGRFAGVVEGSLDLSRFRAFATVTGVTTLLLDHTGQVILVTGTHAYPPLTTASELVAAMPSGKRVIRKLGGDWYLAVRATSGRGWSVIAGRPMRVIHEATIWGSLVTGVAVIGALFASFAFARRITERFSRPLRESEQRFREIVEQSFGLICIHDLDGRLLSVNPSAAEVLGFRIEDMVGGDLKAILTDDALAQYDDYMRRVRTEGHAEGMMEVRTRSGEKRIWVYRNRLVEEGDRSYVLGHALDITERRRAENVLMRQALEDPLTGLANRALFRDRLEHEIERAHREGTSVALLYIDLDGFKRINDVEVHAAGDTILHEAAARLRTSVRASDTVARLGGDEFAVILAEAGGEKQASVVAHAIQQNLSGPYDYRGRSLHVSASVGLSLYPTNAVTAAELIEDADASMYGAKRAGRNRVQLSSTRARSVTRDAIDSAV